MVMHNRPDGRSRCGREAGRVRQSNGTGTLRAQRNCGTLCPQLQNLLAIRIVDCLFSLAAYFSNVRTYWITALI
jgi:hypothetical protein